MATLVPLCCAPPSSLENVEATPESASLGFRLTVTSVLFHAGGADAVVVGAVRSMLTAGLVTEPLLLPALSLTEALAVRPLPSPLITLSAGAVAGSIPDKLSEPVQWIVTLPLYQLAAFWLVVGAPLSAGPTLSMLTPLTIPLAVLPARSETVPLVTLLFAPFVASTCG